MESVSTTSISAASTACSIQDQAEIALPVKPGICRPPFHSLSRDLPSVFSLLKFSHHCSAAFFLKPGTNLGIYPQSVCFWTGISENIFGLSKHGINILSKYLKQISSPE
jgi:hypothetical protein